MICDMYQGSIYVYNLMTCYIVLILFINICLHIHESRDSTTLKLINPEREGESKRQREIHGEKFSEKLKPFQTFRVSFDPWNQEITAMLLRKIIFQGYNTINLMVKHTGNF